jgi:hypothetical protein
MNDSDYLQHSFLGFPDEGFVILDVLSHDSLIMLEYSITTHIFDLSKWTNAYMILNLVRGNIFYLHVLSDRMLTWYSI